MVKTRKNKKMVGGAGDYYTESTVIMKDKTTGDEVGMVKLPEYKDNEKLYLKTYGLLKMPKGLDFADDFKNMVDNAYNSLNSDPKKTPEFEPHVEFIPSSHGAKYNMIFGKFREYLIKNKDVIADKLVVANAIFTPEYLKEDPITITTHEFVFVPSSAPASSVLVDDAIEALNAFFTRIIDDNPPLSPEEMKVITDPDNYENAIFVIGQVFGIIAPDFNGDLLKLDNDAMNTMNAMFDLQIFIDLYNKLKSATTTTATATTAP